MIPVIGPFGMVLLVDPTSAVLIALTLLGVGLVALGVGVIRTQPDPSPEPMPSPEPHPGYPVGPHLGRSLPSAAESAR